jgi:hypothetical protein
VEGRSPALSDAPAQRQALDERLLRLPTTVRSVNPLAVEAAPEGAKEHCTRREPFSGCRAGDSSGDIQTVDRPPHGKAGSRCEPLAAAWVLLAASGLVGRLGSVGHLATACQGSRDPSLRGSRRGGHASRARDGRRSAVMEQGPRPDPRERRRG